MVHLATHVYPEDLITAWLERVRRRYPNFAEIKDDFNLRYDLLNVFMDLEFEEIERKTLLAVVNNCNKTALVLPSNEAMSYAQLLTPKRGNAGHEVYFKKYIAFYVNGLVTPPFLTRLARMKESGVLEWWSNITEYVSLVQFRGSGFKALLVENGITGASLEGNIFVIFSLLLGGLSFATIGFLIEMMLHSVASFIFQCSYVISRCMLTPLYLYAHSFRGNPTLTKQILSLSSQDKISFHRKKWFAPGKILNRFKTTRLCKLNG